MSESSRYRGALRYDPSRSVGLYPDSRDISQLPIVPVGSRTPIQFVPRLSTVATTDPVLLAAPPEQVYGDIPIIPDEPFIPPPPPQTGGEMAAPDIDVMGLVARYGPRVANELYKRLRGEDDALGTLQNPGDLPVVPWGGDQFGYVPQGAHPFGDGGVYWSPEGLPDFSGAIVPGPAAAANSGWGGGSLNYTPDAMGGGAYMMPGGSEGMWDGAVLPKTEALPAAPSGGADASSGGLGSITEGIQGALGTAGAAGAITAQLGGAFGDFSGLAGAGMSALGGWMGNNLAHAVYQNNGAPENINTGSAIGAAIGGVILPVVGAFPGAAIGGMIGGSINPQPDYDQAFANFSVNPQGTFDATGIVRNNGNTDIARNLAEQAQMYWSDLAAAQGYAPNAAMANQGFRFGVGQGDNMMGGWFLQPYAGDATLSDVRPDMFGLTVQDDARRAQVAAEVAAQYRPGGNGIFAGPDMAAQRGDEFMRPPASLQEALDIGFNRLVDLGFYAPAAAGPSPQDVQANIDAQRAWAEANPQMVEVSGDSTWMMPVPWADQFTYNPGWQAPVSQAAAVQPYVESNG